MNKIDLSGVCGVGLDETASKRGHNYVTIFIDMDRESRPVIFACPGKGKECLNEFAKFLKQQAGNVDNIAEVVCDMSPAFIAAATEQFPNAAITVDWFHVVKLFTDAMDSVRRAEAKTETLPKGTRWAILKGDKTSRAQRAYRARTELVPKIRTGMFACPSGGENHVSTEKALSRLQGQSSVSSVDQRQDHGRVVL